LFLLKGLTIKPFFLLPAVVFKVDILATLLSSFCSPTLFSHHLLFKATRYQWINYMTTGKDHFPNNRLPACNIDSMFFKIIFKMYDVESEVAKNKHANSPP
jgi:hypothetical protein